MQWTLVDTSHQYYLVFQELHQHYINICCLVQQEKRKLLLSSSVSWRAKPSSSNHICLAYSPLRFSYLSYIWQNMICKSCIFPSQHNRNQLVPCLSTKSDFTTLITIFFLIQTLMTSNLSVFVIQ